MGAGAIDAVTAVRALLASNDARAATERRLPRPVIDALRSAGAYRMLTPPEYGGEPCDLADVLGAIEAVGQGSGAAGWNLATNSAASIAAGLLPDEGKAVLYGEGPDVVIAGAAAPGDGQATPVDGGYRVSASRRFGSGCQDAMWMTTTCQITGSDPSEFLGIWVPVDDVRIVENWDVMGLAGTGSHDWYLDDVFVPRHLTARGAAPPWPGFGARIPIMFFAAVHFSAVATGLARRAVDALVELAPTKTPLGTGRLLRDQHQVQEALGRAEARLESARVYRAAVVADAWTATMAGERASLPMLMGMRLAGTNAVEAAVDVVTAMFRAAGTTAILEASPLGAAFRDVHVIAQNFTVQPRNYEGAGRLSLGLDVSVTGW